ncbi:unnamed protein product [marine sediment metagenome]|uniref:Uncharacterized protein n=1 Tax=marine sediment metagenome TaxID=412755 RepID=X1MTE3_9ZZZZ
MSNEGAVENIAKKIYIDWNKGELSWEELPDYRKDAYREWVKDFVVPEFDKT